HGGLELVAGKGRHALDAAHLLRRIPDREAQQRFRVGRIDDVDEIVVSLGVVDRLKRDAELLELGARLAGALGLLECPLRIERAEQNIPHEDLPDVISGTQQAAQAYTLRAILAPRLHWLRLTGASAAHARALGIEHRPPGKRGGAALAQDLQLE